MSDVADPTARRPKGHPLTDDDIDAEVLGFEPAVSATGADDTAAPRRTDESKRRRPRVLARRPRIAFKPRRRLGRRLSATVVLLAALGLLGSLYAAFATSSGASDNGTSAQDIAAGQGLYENSCITCHGANLQGVKGQGPSLIGVGQAAAYFQVITGRMPVAGQGAYIAAKKPRFDAEQTDQIAAYVESVGGGPTVPHGDLRGDAKSIANGGALYRINCASCHGATGKGAPLSAGKIAPSLNTATDKELYAAMLSGPESMPVFSDNSITPDEKRSIIAYVQNMKASKDPGGNGIDRIGPVSEAIVIWVAGVGALMIAILWIGARSRG